MPKDNENLISIIEAWKLLKVTEKCLLEKITPLLADDFEKISKTGDWELYNYYLYLIPEGWGRVKRYLYSAILRYEDDNKKESKDGCKS